MNRGAARNAQATVLVPGNGDDFWAWALGPKAVPADLRLSVRLGGRPETGTAEALLLGAVTGDTPDVVLLRPNDALRFARGGLLADIRTFRAVADVRTHSWTTVPPTVETPAGVWGVAAGVTMPLLLARADDSAAPALPDTWDALYAAAAAQTPNGEVVLDPGPLEASFEWLRRRAGIPADGRALPEPPGWRPMLRQLRALHDAPSASRFWQKCWAPTTPTFRRGRARLALGDTETLRATVPGARGVRAAPIPPIGAEDLPYPAAVPGVWVVPRGADTGAAARILDLVTSPDFAVRVAHRRGWAPVRRDAWEGMGPIVAHIPAWQTVRGLLEHGVSVEQPDASTSAGRAALARAAGLWLAGVFPDISEAWATAERGAQASTALVPPILPRLDAHAGLPPGRATPPFTGAQGETMLLELSSEPLSRLSAADGAMVHLQNPTREWSVPGALLVRTAPHDGLGPPRVSPNSAEDTGPLFVEFHIPANAPTGTYAVTVRTPSSALRTEEHWNGGALEVTHAVTPDAPPSALCGLGLPEQSPYGDTVRRLLLDHGFTPFPLSLDSPFVRHPQRGPVVLRRWHDPTRAEADAAAAQARGLLPDVLEYSYDEPTLLHFPHIRREASQYRTLGLRVLVTHPPDPVLEGAAQVWGVHTALRPTDTPSPDRAWRSVLERMARARGRGEDVWWYTAGDVAPLPSLQLDADLNRLRATFFRLPALGFTGILQPEAAAWGDDPMNLDRGPLGRGEGVLCFPAPDGGGGVRPSLRLKALRDGLFTWRLLNALRETLQSRVEALPNARAWGSYPDERLAAYGRRVVMPAALALEGFVHPLMHVTTDGNSLGRAGRALRHELAAALDGPLLLVRGDTPDWSVTTASRLRLWGRAAPGARVAINGRVVRVDPGGRFEWSGPLHEGWNAVECTIRADSKSYSTAWHVWRARGPLSGA